jgi:hypothetical protein
VKISWLLPINVLLWGASIPAMNYSVMALSAHRIAKVPDAALPIFILVLLLWAGFIYWRLVPAMQNPYQRIIVLVLFVGTMCLVGLGALWVAFVVAVATFGL